MFSKALVPVNDSDLSCKVVEMAAECVEKGIVDKLVLFSVWEADEIDYTKLHSAEKEAKYKTNAQIVLDKHKLQLNQGYIEAEYVRAGGDPSELILDHVKDDDYDLIIMGSRKINKVQELVFGSVSDRVTRLSDIPILVVK
ncbi:MAG: universal stress protein [Bacillota bacterium]|nr:universal stress protein [Bacillota bacterium]